MAVRLAALILALAGSTARCWAAESVMAQPFAMRTADYPAWGFKLQVPRASVAHSLPTKGDVLLSEMHKYGDLVYLVEVTRTPPNTLASTAIEQTLQAMVKSSSALGPSGRWELESRQGELFKGVSRMMPLGEADDPGSTLIRKTLRGREAFQSLCMAVLGDESEPILTLGVVGPKNRDKEIENITKFTAYNVTIAGRTAAASAPPSDNAKSSSVLDGSAASRRALKKGEIELEGLVESIEADGKKMTMIVDQIVMPGLEPIRLDPVRRKQVFYFRLPDGVEAGVRVRIVGKNTGVGKPMTADVIVVVRGA